jgi:hypothetical protein
VALVEVEQVMLGVLGAEAQRPVHMGEKAAAARPAKMALMPCAACAVARLGFSVSAAS